MNLLNIPPELQLMIAAYLTPPERQLLRMTSRHFHNLHPSPTLRDLYIIEFSPYNPRQYKTCSNCALLYPSSNFIPHSELAAGVVVSRMWAVSDMCSVCRYPRNWFRPDGLMDRCRRNREAERRLRGKRLGRAWWDLDEWK